MRHGNKLNHLGRKSAHRKAMISNMACSLIQHKRITTTVAKAKALRVFVEPLLTKGCFLLFAEQRHRFRIIPRCCSKDC
jgi:ribosomal protein L17